MNQFFSYSLNVLPCINKSKSNQNPQALCNDGGRREKDCKSTIPSPSSLRIIHLNGTVILCKFSAFFFHFQNRLHRKVYSIQISQSGFEIKHRKAMKFASSTRALWDKWCGKAQEIRIILSKSFAAHDVKNGCLSNPIWRAPILAVSLFWQRSKILSKKVATKPGSWINMINEKLTWHFSASSSLQFSPVVSFWFLAVLGSLCYLAILTQ